MKCPFKTFVAAVSLTGGLVPAVALGDGGSTSNGGDILAYKFAMARNEAAEIVGGLSESALPAGLDPAIKDFLLSHRTQLVDDIAGSPHVWSDEPQSFCALTTRTSKAAINLSVPACQTAGFAEAIPLLIHESIHHLGIDDEAFAYAASQAAYEGREESDPSGLCERLAGTWRRTEVWPSSSHTPLREELVIDHRGCREFFIKGIVIGFEIFLKNRRETWQRVKDDATYTTYTQLFFRDLGLSMTFRNVVGMSSSSRPDDVHQGVVTFKLQPDGGLVLRAHEFVFSEKDMIFDELTSTARGGEGGARYVKEAKSKK